MATVTSASAKKRAFTTNESPATPHHRRPLSQSRFYPVYRVLGYLVMIATAAFILLPFAWMVSASLKHSTDVFTVPVEWIPDPAVWHNYVEIFAKADMVNWIKNTLFLSVVVTFLQVFTGSFAAYGFSKARFPGRNVLFLAYIGTYAVPWQAYMIPQFILMSKLHLANTLFAIIALQAFSPFGVFLMKQFFDTVPYSLTEAARIDGLSEYAIYRRIMLPLSIPAIASLSLLTFVTTWNDYLGPLIYLRDPAIWTVQLGLNSFVGQYNTEFGLVMTGAVLSVLPVAIIFAAGQRYFIEGIATTGVKG